MLPKGLFVSRSEVSVVMNSAVFCNSLFGISARGVRGINETEIKEFVLMLANGFRDHFYSFGPARRRDFWLWILIY